MSRYICIHGHFYQPPRENPWLEEVELQDSAYPYHDWNQRITAESYAPNTVSRILGADRKIIEIENNYSKISFNFGPTLLSWMERNEPEVYRAILEADKESRKNFSGHGTAIAQCYNHMIMPLANSRDKRTQVVWGIRDFEHRFGRKPEGMWLPETAVDRETLDIMSEYGITFTILAPRQARRVRKLGDKRWKDVSKERIDPLMPYVCRLPSGRKIALFFHDGPVSGDVAFGNLLENGENFAARLVSAFSDQEHAQLVNIATDGETYGHHRYHGDMALAYCLYYLEFNQLARLTVYGEYAEKHPPTHEVEIFENSSWSCIHGIERWRDNCGCKSGMIPEWTQDWRGSLRGAMNWLRDNLVHVYEEQISHLVRDPWYMRDTYIDVMLDRSHDNVERFLAQHALRALSAEEKVSVLKLLEMQRHAQLMYTSCGWFFDEISSLEPVQVLQYAARAMQLAREVSSMSLEDTYVSLLEHAPSNIYEFKNGAQVYELQVKPAVLDLVRVGAHYAVSSLFEEYPETTKIYSYTVHSQFCDRAEAGKQKLCAGKLNIRSDVTREEDIVSFAVVHLGDHNVVGGVRPYSGEEAFYETHREIREVFERGDISETIRFIEKHFAVHSYSLWHLFKDQQRRILNQILDTTLQNVEVSLRQIHEQHYSIIQVMKQMNIPLPKIFAATEELILNTDLLRVMLSDEWDADRFQKFVDEAKRWSIDVDKTTLGFVGTNRINQLMERFSSRPQDFSLLETVESILNLLQRLSVSLNLWRVKNIYFFVGKQWYSEMKTKADRGDDTATKWVEHFARLGEYLDVRIT